MPQPTASLSLDLDDKWSYLKTHGDAGWEGFPSYLDRVVPRLLALLDDLELRITVFIVGQDAANERNRCALGSIASAGHEIGNHSFHHEPWLHLYSPQQIEDEIAAAEDAILAATSVRPVGFRGPGYSHSPAVLECLVRRGYLYDASTLPTVVGPLARAYYFLTTRLTPHQRRERSRLVGGITEGLRPIKPYPLRFGDDDDSVLWEVPVTTFPLLRFPIHFSYLLYLRQLSQSLAWAYWRMSLGVCQAARIEPSLLLHPLDVLGGDEEPELGFFPAMRMSGNQKRAFVRDLLNDFRSRFRVLPLEEYVHTLIDRQKVAQTAQELAGRRLPPAPRLPVAAEPAIPVEAGPQ
jgi:peptidoglycan-N-acetylglucosamine deacetylase